MKRQRRLERLIEEVREGYAPDPRLDIFEISFEADDEQLALTGATSVAAAAAALHREAVQLDGWQRVRDEVERLPAGPAESRHVLAAAAVVPLLAGPIISETHVSQVVLGRRLTILRRKGRWLQCRCEDGYLGWVHRGYTARVDAAGARDWEEGSGGELCVSLGARVLDQSGEVVARLPWGARVIRLPDGTVRLPDDIEGHPSGELITRDEQLRRFPARGEEMVETALRWSGAPYLWGGVTPAGVDCSGLVQAVFHLHGLHLPRDSDLQARTGEPLEPNADFSNLRAGDLLFFAETPERISHVAMSMGGSRVVHSSIGNGGVRRNDVTGELPYEQELREIFVCARRHL